MKKTVTVQHSCYAEGNKTLTVTFPGMWLPDDPPGTFHACTLVYDEEEDETSVYYVSAGGRLDTELPNKLLITLLRAVKEWAHDEAMRIENASRSTSLPTSYARIIAIGPVKWVDT